MPLLDPLRRLQEEGLAGLFESVGLRHKLPMLLGVHALASTLGSDPRQQLLTFAWLDSEGILYVWLDRDLLPYMNLPKPGEKALADAVSRLPTPSKLREAAEAGDVAEVTRLCETGIGIDLGTMRSPYPTGMRIDPQGGDWALQMAAKDGRLGVMRALLGAGADVNRSRPRIGTALMAAAKANQWGAAQLLLAAGANHAAVDSNGDSALDWAQRQGSETAAQVLAVWAEAETDEAKWELQAAWAAEALRQAAGMHGQLEELKRLLEDGADHAAVDEHGDSALAIAKAYGNQPAVAVLEAWAAEHPQARAEGAGAAEHQG